MRGFRQSYEYLVDLCSDYDVVLIQELWLASFDLYKLDNVCNNIICFNSPALYLQCFDAVGWAAGRASGL